ncbi:hypothetical protein OsI_00251 [Oryza sativa Indica Group]|uniref:Uncharacterized protein n=1 Tax=Oryza sativa subsp. indica TaxID=39946 RepID=A2WKA2_ORYSI|nr:hypothetical protein OsI_00251 [Oryza sativa Indica Group]
MAEGGGEVCCAGDVEADSMWRLSCGLVGGEMRMDDCTHFCQVTHRSVPDQKSQCLSLSGPSAGTVLSPSLPGVSMSASVSELLEQHNAGVVVVYLLRLANRTSP